MKHRDYIINQIFCKDPDREIIVIAYQMETEIIQIAHRQGHFSSKKAQDLVKKSYFIPKLKEVLKVIGSYVECILVNSKAGGISQSN